MPGVGSLALVEAARIRLPDATVLVVSAAAKENGRGALGSGGNRCLASLGKLTQNHDIYWTAGRSRQASLASETRHFDGILHMAKDYWAPCLELAAGR